MTSSICNVRQAYLIQESKTMENIVYSKFHEKSTSIMDPEASIIFKKFTWDGLSADINGLVLLMRIQERWMRLNGPYQSTRRWRAGNRDWGLDPAKNHATLVPALCLTIFVLATIESIVLIILSFSIKDIGKDVYHGDGNANGSSNHS
jgi:hypothetical protein